MDRETSSSLQRAADEFVRAGRQYYFLALQAGIMGGLLWTTTSDGDLAIYAPKGKYKRALLKNIEPIGDTFTFGCVDDTPK